MNSTFTEIQKQYLEGFFAGVAQRESVPFVGQTSAGLVTNNPVTAASGNQATPELAFGIPLADLCKEELIKHEEHGLDVWDKIAAHARADKFPQGGDIFRFKFFGLFYVTPAQEALMLRCRIAGCMLTADQLDCLADIAQNWGPGCAHITTRGNVQIREIMPRNAINTLIHLQDCGLTSKGAGADNVRNVTASPTAGFDPEEVLNVLPLARAMHHYILNNRDLYNLPRKFNIAFDGGGSISVCADTNDIAFYAVRVKENSHDVEPGIYFRLQLCGITGHKQFATDSGLMLKPDECIAVAAAMLRVFVQHGDRTNRKKARLKYLIDKWGVDKFLTEVQTLLDFPLTFASLDVCEKRVASRKVGYVGVYPQSQEGFCYVGVNVPVGRLSVEQMRGVAHIARKYGRSDIRLTVWQNLILPHIAVANLPALQAELMSLGLSIVPNFISSGLVACTGNRGCKYAATDTKGHALHLGEFLSERIILDQPINIHLTGCSHSCAQHYIGDIGLLGATVKREGQSVEGYHVYVGGGVDDQQGIARELATSVPFDELPFLLESVLRAYLENRVNAESFATFTRRLSIEDLKNYIETISTNESLA